jgi:hypothetical protein
MMWRTGFNKTQMRPNIVFVCIIRLTCPCEGTMAKCDIGVGPKIAPYITVMQEKSIRCSTIVPASLEARLDSISSIKMSICSKASKRLYLN